MDKLDYRLGSMEQDPRQFGMYVRRRALVLACVCLLHCCVCGLVVFGRGKGLSHAPNQIIIIHPPKQNGSTEAEAARRREMVKGLRKQVVRFFFLCSWAVDVPCPFFKTIYQKLTVNPTQPNQTPSRLPTQTLIQSGAGGGAGAGAGGGAAAGAGASEAGLGPRSLAQQRRELLSGAFFSCVCVGRGVVSERIK